MEQRNKVLVGKVIDAPKGKPIVAVVSTEDVDLDGDVIRQGPSDKGRGWVLDGFNKSGRVYWMHNPFVPNLAKASARVDGGRLLLSVKFDEGDEFARALDRKYREGFLEEWSVGFRPVEGKFEENEHGGFTFYEQTLDEVSAVNQGANPHTETVSKAMNDYLDGVAEAKAIVESFDRRLREVEGFIMREEREREERRLRAILEEVNQIRSRA